MTNTIGELVAGQDQVLHQGRYVAGPHGCHEEFEMYEVVQGISTALPGVREQPSLFIRIRMIGLIHHSEKSLVLPSGHESDPHASKRKHFRLSAPH